VTGARVIAFISTVSFISIDDTIIPVEEPMATPVSPFQQPSERDLARLKALYQLVSTQEDIALSASTEKPIPMPGSLVLVLRQILGFMSLGKGVAVTPVLRELTTQGAAELLGVSRPFLIELLNKQEIPFHLVGTHRRIYLQDLLRYRDHRDRQRKEILNRMAREAVEEGDYDRVYAADDGE
jgi:excisionase family DNA binding protein